MFVHLCEYKPAHGPHGNTILVVSSPQTSKNVRFEVYNSTDMIQAGVILKKCLETAFYCVDDSKCLNGSSPVMNNN